MAAAGDFCLEDPFFPGSPRDSLLFKEDDLTSLKRKGFHVSTYREEKPQPTIPKEDKHQSPHVMENAPSFSHKRRNHARSVAGPLGPHHPEYLTPQAARSHLTRENALPQPRNSQTTMILRTTTPP